jgi:hypothetical protein
MTPEERERVVNYAKEQQAQGHLLAWTVDEEADVATFFVPLSASDIEFPTNLEGTRILLTWLPDPEEFSDWLSLQLSQ